MSLDAPTNRDAATSYDQLASTPLIVAPSKKLQHESTPTLPAVLEMFAAKARDLRRGIFSDALALLSFLGPFT